jgi:GNAT superfamily N-acetyltransferase
MSAVAREAAGSVLRAVTRRWQATDPLLPPPAAPETGCGARLAIAGPGGHPVALGVCEHWAGAPGSLDLTWGAARRFQLTALASGQDMAGALDRLISLWRDHLAGVPGAGGDDTAAVVTWASRDVGGITALLRHGLAPQSVIAARLADHRIPPSADDGQPGGEAAPAARRGLRIRRAGPGDIDAVTRLGLEVIRFDAHFGGVTERAGTGAALHREAAGWLAEPGSWTWLAERDGTAVGMLAAERPAAAGWIAPMVSRAPVAYIPLMFVSPAERRRGAGTALAARLHREARTAGVAVTLLHYEQVNPLSVPFWSRQGYRPLWTSWEARPAGTLR